jgi:hypothetical protein
MHASFWRLLRPPILVDHEMPYVEDGALEPENVERAFPNDLFQQLVVRILVAAAFDNDKLRLKRTKKKVIRVRRMELMWAGVNFAYIERWVSAWWAADVKSVWWWPLKLLLFRRSFAVGMSRAAVYRLIKAGMLDEQIEWDLIEEGGYYGITSNQKMPVCYPTPALVETLNAALPKAVD